MTTREEATATALQWATDATAHLQAAAHFRTQAESIRHMVGARRDHEQLLKQAETRTAAHHEARQTALMWTEIANLLPEPEPLTLAQQVHRASRKTVESWMAQDAEKTGEGS